MSCLLCVVVEGLRDGLFGALMDDDKDPRAGT